MIGAASTIQAFELMLALVVSLLSCIPLDLCDFLPFTFQLKCRHLRELLYIRLDL